MIRRKLGTELRQCNIYIKELNVKVENKVILDISNISFRPGIHAVIGPNGAGKTTLLNVLAGIITPPDSSVSVCGQKPEHSRDIIGYLPAMPMVDLLATVENVIEAGLYRARTVNSTENIYKYSKKLGVDRLLTRRFSTLSSGEQKLVCIARVLAREPLILLLDEPFSFLDVSNQVKIFKTIESYTSENNAISIITTHEIHYIDLFDTVTLLKKGRLLYSGMPSELRSELLSEAYGITVRELSGNGRRVFMPKFS